MHINPLVRFLRRVKAFLLPMSGWAERVRRYRRGQVTWTVPSFPLLPPMAPWPPEWTVVEFSPTGDGGATVVFHDGHSDVSGKEAKGDDLVRCSRCGIHLHVGETEMETNIDVPACSWCVGYVRQL